MLSSYPVSDIEDDGVELVIVLDLVLPGRQMGADPHSSEHMVSFACQVLRSLMPNTRSCAYGGMSRGGPYEWHVRDGIGGEEEEVSEGMA